MNKRYFGVPNPYVYRYQEALTPVGIDFLIHLLDIQEC